MSDELPEQWQQVRLGEIVKPGYGKALDKSLRKDVGRYPVVGSGGLMAYTDSALVEGEVVVVGRKGNVGEVQVFRDGVWPIDTAYFLKPPQSVDIGYLFHFLIAQEMKKLDSSTTTPSLRREDLEAVNLRIPCLEEQREIVRILEEQFSRLDAAAASIAAVRRKADQFRRSLAYAVFGGHVTGAELSPNKNYGEWENVQLGDLLDDVQPGFASGRHNAEGRGVIHVRPMNISRLGRLDLAETKHVEVSDGHRLQRGDVLFNNTNSPALIGKTALIDSDKELAFSNHMTRLRVKRDLVMPDFLALRLHALWHEGFFQEICSNHVNQASVSSKRLKQVEIRLPSLEQQSEIVDLMNVGHGHVDTTLHNATSVERSLSATRRSLLQAAFTGELTKEWREKNNG